MGGRANRNCREYHRRCITMWNDRSNRVIQGTSFNKNGHLCDNTLYMQWYISHTINYISLLQQFFDDDVTLFFFIKVVLLLY